MPAYLESSNPANVNRYRRLGFEPIGEIFVPDGLPRRHHDVATGTLTRGASELLPSHATAPSGRPARSRASP